MFDSMMRAIRRWRYGEAIVIISGLPRSGTSMLMRMIAAGGLTILTDHLRAADDDNPKGYFEYERVKKLEEEADKSWVQLARGKGLKVISHLLKALPDDNYYRVILCERDLYEVIASQNTMLQRRGEPNPITDTKAIELYRKHLLNVKVLLKSKPNFDMLEVGYCDALNDPRACAERINEFLGGRLDPEKMANAVDPRLYRNRKAEFLSATALALLVAVMVPDVAQAYIGPGAGFALVGSFLALLMALGAGLAMFLLWPLRYLIRSFRRRRARGRARIKRIVILGLDGLDPELAERWMAQGHLPNLEKLAQQGSFSRLQTTYPSISPVAWSSFMTGVDPTRHNVFDFLNRDLRNYKPKLSSSEVGSPSRVLRVGSWAIPLGRPIIRNMRKSRAFWRILGEHGVSSNIIRVPLTFPPERFAGMLLSAMCVPDLRGTQGAFTYYTSDPTEVGLTEAAPETTGGERRLVEIKNGVIEARLAGPENPLRRDGTVVEIPFSVHLKPDRGTCLLKLGGGKYRLKEKEYSPWIRVIFKPGFGVKVYGIVRFYVTRLVPHFGLYVTPINIDPAKPALPISWPPFYSIYLAKLIGEFATLGLAEDTWALNERVIDEEAFLKQALDHHAEREKMFFNAIEKSREGVVACVFDGTDRLQHMFFRYLDQSHPANRGKDMEKFKWAILDMYKRADDMVGRVMERLGPKDIFLVISDHGFQSFRRGVNLNTWLMQQGLLHLKNGSGGSGDWFENVDWSRTKAYAFGLGGLYINQKGREGQGVVAPGEETQAVKGGIIEGLSGLRDEECGEIAINEVFDTDRVHSSGPYKTNGPDLIIGYNRGYRASWEGAVGRVTDTVISDNTKSWSGDHCIDPRLVPGVLFCNWRIAAQEPAIHDLAPTILSLFGVEVPSHMTGKVLQVELPAQTP
jgi:predicted AlkP superfamily phosphohydrolase/phosphomutase